MYTCNEKDSCTWANHVPRCISNHETLRPVADW